jgi:hypothetical protein
VVSKWITRFAAVIMPSMLYLCIIISVSWRFRDLSHLYIYLYKKEFFHFFSLHTIAMIW